MRKLGLLFIIYHLSFSPAGAQSWTLQQCIDHAVSHNITIGRQQLQVEQQALQLSNARNQRLPDLSASAGQNFSFGRGLTADNTYSNTNTSSTNFSVGTTVPLFTGFQIPNQIRLSQLNLEAATHDLERAKNDIRVQVAQQYVQVLYDMEMLGVARRLTSRPFLEGYEAVTKKGGFLAFKTDNEDLFRFSVEQMKLMGYDILAYTEDLHNSPLAENNIVTEYEARFLAEGKPIFYIRIGF